MVFERGVYLLRIAYARLSGDANIKLIDININ